MPKIKRSVEYTFQAYSGVSEGGHRNEHTDMSKLNAPLNENGTDSDNDSKFCKSFKFWIFAVRLFKKNV